MDTSRVRAFAEAVGLTAVVASLGLLTWEVNQSNSLAKANVYSDVSRDYNEYNLLMASNGEFAEILSHLTEEEVELSAIDVQRTIGIGSWNRNAWNSAERAYLEGWIPQDKYQATLNDIAFMVKQWPGLKPYLRMLVEELGKDTDLTMVERKILELTQK
ncbi:MAG: hypothetical protein O7C67_01295 [Gammaproteobacteria bacterium]|nr:hypothetical protein [Gammaproteobacteria bacterium]